MSALVPAKVAYSELEHLASKIARSSVVPPNLRNKPDEVLAVFALAAEVGLPPVNALKLIDFLNGRPELNSQAKRALIQRAGHHVKVSERELTYATVMARRADEVEWEAFTYTMDDAVLAGLAQKDNWKKNPKAMLVARATALAAREKFADVLLGEAWDAEELDDDHLGAEPARVVVASTEGFTVSERAANALVQLCRSLSLDDREVMLVFTGGASDDVSSLLTSDVSAFHETAKRLAMERDVAGRPAEVVAEVVEESLPPVKSRERDHTISQAQQSRIHATFAELGVDDRDVRLAYVSAALGRDVESSKNLSKLEASVLIDRLNEVRDGRSELVIGDDGRWVLRSVAP